MTVTLTFIRRAEDEQDDVEENKTVKHTISHPWVTKKVHCISDLVVIENSMLILDHGHSSVFTLELRNHIYILMCPNRSTSTEITWSKS
jgi:hypothetical protein